MDKVVMGVVRKERVKGKLIVVVKPHKGMETEGGRTRQVRVGRTHCTFDRHL